MLPSPNIFWQNKTPWKLLLLFCPLQVIVQFLTLILPHFCGVKTGRIASAIIIFAIDAQGIFSTFFYSLFSLHRTMFSLHKTIFSLHKMMFILFFVQPFFLAFFSIFSSFMKLCSAFTKLCSAFTQLISSFSLFNPFSELCSAFVHPSQNYVQPSQNCIQPSQNYVQPLLSQQWILLFQLLGTGRNSKSRKYPPEEPAVYHKSWLCLAISSQFR